MVKGLDHLRGERTSHLIGHVLYIALYISLIASSIIFYNSANLTALSYAGWIIFACGLAILVSSSQTRRKSYRMREAFTQSGLYAYVRHPEFLGHMLIIVSLVFMAQHPISIAMGSALLSLLCIEIMEEERRNLKRFGDAYKDYMRRVPRINLLTGIIKSRRERKSE
ncbi:MAG: hypothetical protein DRN59_01425 [Thaumarchaeota archaeon]|nr:MAG: hypothetical protein DRN59_01425 [Nitrososphaerota archaeon]